MTTVEFITLMIVALVFAEIGIACKLYRTRDAFHVGIWRVIFSSWSLVRLPQDAAIDFVILIIFIGILHLQIAGEPTVFHLPVITMLSIALLTEVYNYFYISL